MRVPLKRGRFRHLKAAYRSGLEALIAASLSAQRIDGHYEQLIIPFTQPSMERTYKPDFVLPNGIIIESKGIFETEDRKKHLWVRAQNPELDIRFVFSNPKGKLYKGSPTTYAMWCEKNGYLFATKNIPKAWLTEPKCPRKVAAVERLGLRL